MGECSRTGGVTLDFYIQNGTVCWRSGESAMSVPLFEFRCREGHGRWQYALTEVRLITIFWHWKCELF